MSINLSNVLDIVADKFIAAGAPDSVRWDVLAQRHALKTTYSKYRWLITSDSDDTAAVIKVSDVVEAVPGVLQTTISCSVGSSSRDVLVLKCEKGN